MVIGAIDETGQEKAGEATAGVKRQYMGCAGRVANGINTVHLSYVRDKAGHALIGARQWIPREHIADPVKSLLMGLPLDLEFRTKGQLAIDVCAAAYADGIGFDFACGDEVYGNCTQLREFFEDNNQAYALRVPSNFTLTLAAGTKMTCAQAVKALLKHERRWEIRSAGSGSKGQRWYAWAWIATASPRHHLLVRRHLKTGDLAFHYCWVPDGQILTKARLIRAAGLRWPVEEDFEFGKDCFGLGQCQARLYTAIARHAVLVMAALAICAITAALQVWCSWIVFGGVAWKSLAPPRHDSVPELLIRTSRHGHHPSASGRRRSVTLTVSPCVSLPRNGSKGCMARRAGAKPR
jgi:SRSO17 transposase